MRRIAVITTSRADYGIYLPVLKLLRETKGIDLQLIVGGTHLLAAYGETVHEIEADGFPISARLKAKLSGDQGGDIARFMAETTRSAADAFTALKPEIAVILGDRYEMLAAALAAVPCNIPLAHIHGGELTEGVIDEQLRHALTKLSHLHFVTTQEYASRVMRMGEQPDRIIVSGAPAIDAIGQFKCKSRIEVAQDLGTSVDQDWLLVTYHPLTLEPEGTNRVMDGVVKALEKLKAEIIITAPNADPENRTILSRFQELAARLENVHLAQNLGQKGYFNVMAHAAAMLGNSSSGLIEAPSFALPVINIGDRQRGRIRGDNVIDVGESEAEIQAGLNKAFDSNFRKSIAGMDNPYGEGKAAEIIVKELVSCPLGNVLLRKEFNDRGDDVSIRS